MMEQPQENRGNNFKAQSFSIKEQQYLYQVEENGEKSIIRIFNSQGKLKSSQPIKLPANALVYTCDQFIVGLTQARIHLFQIANINMQANCQNPGVERIRLVRYDQHLKLIFFLSYANQLYYILPQLNTIKVKRILSSAQLSQNNISGQPIKLQIDHNNVVKLLCGRNLYCIRFKWNQNDRLQDDIVKIDNVVDVYCRQKWSVVIKESEQDEENYLLEITDENNNNTPNRFSSNVPKFAADDLPIMKSTPSNLLYFDRKNKAVIVINQSEQVYQKDLNVDFPSKKKILIYEIKRSGSNNLHLLMHFFEGTGENFKNVQIPFKLIDADDEQNILFYIHNNIHLILTQQGVERHFTEKVKQFLGIQLERESIIPEDHLTRMLLRKLFETSPLTITKLGKHFRKQSHRGYLPSFLSKYLEYVPALLHQIPFIQSLSGVPTAKQESFLESVNKLNQEYHSQQYQKAKTKLQSMITFYSMLLFAIKEEQVNSQRKQAEKKQMREENTAGWSKYYQTVQRLKAVYLLNQIYYKFTKDIRLSLLGQMVEEGRQISAISASSKIEEEYLDFKIGVRACHQLFDYRLPQKLTNKDSIKFLADCDNFYHAVYLYLNEFKQQKEAPYVGDEETINLIRFLLDSPVSVLNNRQQLRSILKNLPQMAAKALVLNEPAFIKYLCSLSVNTSQYKSCLAMLISGVGRQWNKEAHFFIIECYILCDRAALAYNSIQDLGRGDFNHQKQLMEQFTRRCIKEKKIKDLLDISKDQEDDKYIRDELNRAFGDDVKEIIDLMEKLNNSQS